MQGGALCQTLLQESLCNVVQHLVDNPNKILLTEKHVLADSNFVVRKGVPKGWSHPTLLYLSSVSKEFWVEVLLEHSHSKADRSLATITEEDLRRMDKAMDRRGIEHLSHYLGQLTTKNHIPNHCRYKPLLKAVMVARMLAMDLSFSIGAGNKVNFARHGTY